jgi:hypothetical protein
MALNAAMILYTGGMKDTDQRHTPHELILHESVKHLIEEVTHLRIRCEQVECEHSKLQERVRILEAAAAAPPPSPVRLPPGGPSSYLPGHAQAMSAPLQAAPPATPPATPAQPLTVEKLNLDGYASSEGEADDDDGKFNPPRMDYEHIR